MTPDSAQASTIGHDMLANAIRALAMDAVEQAKAGHPGMPMGMADVATVLFTRFLKYDPEHPEWPDRDRFVLSAGHGSMLLYALLYLTGYADMTMEEIRRFRQLHSRTPGHPEWGHAAGVETTTGPLGQGLANAVGMAIAERLLATRFGPELVDHHTYCVVGDGCLMEGISHEALSLAGHLRLSKLIVLFDDNHISIDGPTSLAVSDDQTQRFAASGWRAEAIDGHDAAQIAGALERARGSDRPSFIACRTTIARGAPTKAGTAASHGSPLGAKEIEGARTALGWTYPAFTVPEPVLAAWRKAGGSGAAAYQAWSGRHAAINHPDFERALTGALPEAFGTTITDLKRQLFAEAPKLATRQASGNVLERLSAAIPELIGGSADLTGSNNTKTKAQAVIARDNFAGRYLHYGVREHGMAAAMNGMALHGGVIPYGGTFLTFSDYCRPAIRLAALMGIRVVHVMTHDSIGLGEDGPTHQPVEHLAALRAIPRLQVFRPADAVETAECWALALADETRPSVIALTRQAVPPVRREHVEENLSARGAYVLAEATGKRRATVMATGSEVQVALAARELLEAKGVATAVVSMPCWSLFDQQSDPYRREVLGEGVRVAVEAAIAFGWERYLGPKGGFVGMTGFGASAPAEDLYKHYGITADAVAAAVLARL
ncbi:MAG: transketolase [Proteobacteria bacterium]|nr:transketolase [Pseudomonadota bacterium]